MPIKLSSFMTTTLTATHTAPMLVGHFGTEGNDQYFGTSGNDVAYGGGGNDLLYGGYGDDRLYGGSGNDIIADGYGNDTLVGGTGADRMAGGAGADTFVFAIGDSGITSATADTITDLGMWDRIDVSDVVANGRTSVVTGTQITSIEQAAGLTNMFVALNGPSDTHAVLYANAATNTSYLVMDMDGNGSFETGIILEGIGNPADNALDWVLT